MGDVQLSVVVLAWDQLPLTMKCVESLRETTDVLYELIIVDNGSATEAAEYAEAAADVSILNSNNRGFAAGMNQGLAAATGEFVAFVNNDTEFPATWASRVLEAFDSTSVGICVPAVTAAGNPVSVRTEVGTDVVVLDRFAELPSGVVYVMGTGVARDLGGWNEMYPVASAEDLDLAFTVWLNDLEIVIDERVLVRHVSQATVRAKLSDRADRYRSNLNLFLDRWSGNDPIVRLPACDLEIHARNRAAGRAAAIWLRRLTQERDVSSGLRRVSAKGSQLVTKPKRRWFQS